MRAQTYVAESPRLHEESPDVEARCLAWSECSYLSVGLSGMAVQFFMTMSLERVGAAKGMAMTYSAIIWSELIGIIIFHDVPNAFAVVGTLIVLYSTIHSSFVQALSRKTSVTETPRSPWSDMDEPVLAKEEA